MSREEINRNFENEVTRILLEMDKLNEELSEIVNDEGYQLTNSQIELCNCIATNLEATVILQGIDEFIKGCENE